MSTPPRQETEAKTVKLHPAFRAAAVFIGALGVFILFAQARLISDSPDWVRYTGFGAVITGVALWLLSGMPREHAIEWIRSGTFAFTLALLIRWPIAEPYRIPSDSMMATLHGDPRMFHGDRVFVNKWVYGVRYPFMNRRIWHGKDPARWDVVVFKSVEAEAEHNTLVKRIVGLPGERIQIRDGSVHVDGEKLAIPDFMPEDQFYTTPFGSHRLPSGALENQYYGVDEDEAYSVIPAGHYLVLGDNSGNSRDGRYFGWLPNEHIVGRVACIWWPPPNWRDFTGFTATPWWILSTSLLSLWVLVRLFFGRSWRVLAAGGNGVDHLFINFLAYGFRAPFTRVKLAQWGAPERGEVILYHPMTGEARDGEMFLGRVAGLPGERVQLNDGKLHVNDAPVTEGHWSGNGKYATEHPDAIYAKSKNKKYTDVPERHYFVLSDVRDKDGEALDSRVLGWVPQTHVLGRASRIWWPLTRAGRLR